MKHRGPMFFIVWAMVAALIILHQDNWLWNNSTLVFGFLPITLLYHMGISVAATVTWFLATRYAWPVKSECEAGASASTAEQNVEGSEA